MGPVISTAVKFHTDSIPEDLYKDTDNISPDLMTVTFSHI